MKILVISEPGVDGVFRYVEALCFFLIEQGVEVHLAYSDRRSCDRLPMLVRWIEENGGRTLNLRTANKPALSDLRALLALVRFSKTVRPDVIHSHSSKAGFLGRILPRFGIKAPQVYNPHAYIGLRLQAGKLDWLYNMIERRLGRKSWTIASSTDERIFAQRHLQIPSRRIFHLPNGVDVNRFSPVSYNQKCDLREKLGLPISRPILGFIGRSSSQKDPSTLYKAFFRSAAGKPITLFHVGKGELDSELSFLVEKSGLGVRVYRCPYMSEPADFYHVVDGVILTSKYEGFSIAALEALSANLPLILSRAPGNMDLINLPLSHTWNAPVGDVEKFSVCIDNWYSNLLKPTPINHRQTAIERFDQQATLSAVLGVYHSLIESMGEKTNHSLETNIDRNNCESKPRFE